MSILIAHLAKGNMVGLRRALSGSGLDCSASDCILWEGLAGSLAHKEPELVVIEVDDDPRLNWDGLQLALSHSRAPSLLVGPKTALTLGASERLGALGHITQQQLHREVQTITEQFRNNGVIKNDRGSLTSVISFAGPTEGAVVAEHLACALNNKNPDEVAVLEVSRQDSEFSPLLDLSPRHTLDDAMDMWQRLDPLSFEKLLTKHASGLRVLPALEVGHGGNIERDPLNRLLLLSRLSNRFTVISLNDYRSEVELETLNHSNYLVVVVYPEVPSLKRAKRFLNTLKADKPENCQIIPVVARWGQAGQIKRSYLEEFLGSKSIVYLPHDPRRLNRAVNQGVLVQSFAPRSVLSKRFQELAQSVNGRK